MARAIDVFVSGTVENLTLYRKMWKSSSRTKRKHRRQPSPASIKNINFGIASRAGKVLRRGLHAVLPFPAEKNMAALFSGAIFKWMGASGVHDLPACDNAAHISTFRFNKEVAFHEYFNVPVSVSRRGSQIITVAIDAFVPARQIKSPPGTVTVKLVFAVAGVMLATGTATGSKTCTIEIPYNNAGFPSLELAFHVPIPEGSLAVTAARLEYITATKHRAGTITCTDLMPAGIVNACYC